jgi:hypothetical protein
VAYALCKKRVTNLIYEARVQAHMDYYVVVLRRKLMKEDARKVTLTREQYLRVNRKYLLLISFEIKYALFDLLICCIPNACR